MPAGTTTPATPMITTIRGTAIPLPGNDIDTDSIIPARYLKAISFEGLGEFAFYDERYDSAGNPQPHPLNDQRYQGGSILLVNRNFGCGSSREHAPQALMRYGITAIVGESFAEIFAGNCTTMGVPVLTLPGDTLRRLMQRATNEPKLPLQIDLRAGTLRLGEHADETHDFDMAAAYRSALLAGTWDATSVLLVNRPRIEQVAAGLPYLDNFATQQ